MVTTATELICVQSEFLEGPSGGSGPAVWERRPDEMRLKGREIISGTVSKYSVETGDTISQYHLLPFLPNQDTSLITSSRSARNAVFVAQDTNQHIYATQQGIPSQGIP